MLGPPGCIISNNHPQCQLRFILHFGRTFVAVLAAISPTHRPEPYSGEKPCPPFFGMS